MQFKEIEELIKLINKSNLTEFKMKDGEFRLSIRTKKYGRGKVVAPQTQIVPVQTSMPVHQPVAAAPVVAAAPAPAKAAPAAETKSASAESEAASNDKYIEIKSPIVGTFYRASSPDKDPYAAVGKRVEVGTVVCIVEAMKLFNEIESEVSGTIVKVIAEDATPVQYDQVLFLVEPD